MKWSLLSLCLLLSLSAASQVYKAQWLIGGNALFNYSKSENEKLTAFQLSPNAGYFFKDKWAVGLRPSFALQTSTRSEKVRTSTIALAPFLRYYFLEADQIMNFFVDGSAGYSWNKIKNLTYGGRYTYHTHHFSIMGGPAFFLNPHTSVEFTVGYTYLSRGMNDTSATHRVQLGVGFQIHLGKNPTERDKMIQTQ